MLSTLQITISEYRLELWPGYITSIRQHEDDVLICAEATHKVMRMETAYEILRNCQQQNGQNWQEAFEREIIGSVVLTKYNHQTYRVDDVDFNSSPRSTFEKKGTLVTYTDYYRQRWQLEIKDQGQPMLVSNPKAKDVRGGLGYVLFLIPELCNATGLTDRMRSDFRLM